MVNELNIDELCGIAIARLGLSVDEFYDLIPLEYNYAIKHTNDRAYDEYKSKMEISRWQLVHMWNMQGKVLKTNVEPKDIAVFPWEEEKVQSVESMKSILLGMASSINRKLNKRKKK